MRRSIACWLSPLLLAACGSVAPSSIVGTATSARPPVAAAVAANNGSIFQSANFKPLFEDVRARAIGDTLTILISEKTSADKKAAATGAATGSVNARTGQLLGVPASSSGMLTLNGSVTSKSDNKDTGSASYNFSSTMGVTVIDVLPNGNLLVSGEKQIGLDRGAEYIRFSGVVPLSAIGAGNVVPSTQVADARIEYRTNTQIDKSQLSSMMNRFFYSLLPL
jgi:flagellar L-ring protein precursor FlgH